MQRQILKPAYLIYNFLRMIQKFGENKFNSYEP